MNKKTQVIAFIAVFLILTLILISNVFAITASIGNARMILRAQTGDILEKSILVKNVNNVSVDILLTASGDLQDSITLKDKSFTLQPNEEKNAFFTIKVTKIGTTESRINVQFTPTGGKNGAGLSSTIVVIANGTDLNENSDVNAENNVDEADNSSDNPVGAIKNPLSSVKIGKNGFAFLTTIILAVIFIILLIVYYKKFNPEKVILTGDRLDEDLDWKNSKDSMIDRLNSINNKEEFLENIDLINSDIKEFKKREKIKQKKTVKTRV
jgi:hypothetical protein